MRTIASVFIALVTSHWSPIAAFLTYRAYQLLMAAWAANRTYKELQESRREPTKVIVIRLQHVDIPENEEDVANQVFGYAVEQDPDPDPDPIDHLSTLFESISDTDSESSSTTSVIPESEYTSDFQRARSMSVGSLDLLPRRRGMLGLITGFGEAERPRLRSVRSSDMVTRLPSIEEVEDR